MLTALRRLARASRKNELAWRYGFNLKPTIAHRFVGRPPTGETGRVLRDLRRDGIAVTSVDALLGGVGAFAALRAAVERVQAERAEDIAAARARARSDDTVGEKTFMLEYLGRNPVLDPSSAFARFALQQPMLDIANGYLGMLSRLRYYNVWHTFATDAKPRESQLWHRDREDLFIVKAFVYLNDVPEGAGPFTYAKGTHRVGPIQGEPEYHLEGRVKRTTDDQMAALVPRSQWVLGTGAAGTVIFADTNGYHKGGHARTADRLMYTCMFTSQASESQEFMVRPPGFQVPLSDALTTFALSSSR
jgi:hypothetical protein